MSQKLPDTPPPAGSRPPPPPMYSLERSDPRVQQHTEAMRRLLTSFENGDVRVQTFTVEMNRQLPGLFRLLGEIKRER